MRNYFKTILLVLSFAGTLSAQNRFYIGPSYTFGLTDIYNGSSGMMSSSSGDQVHYYAKPGFGTGLRTEYFFSKRVGSVVEFGYMQRGARFDLSASSYPPCYRLSYLDALFGLKYKLGEKKNQLFIDGGISEHTLIDANRVNTYTSVNMMEDMHWIDWGAFLGAGIQVPVFDKDVAQARIFCNVGFSNMMSGIFQVNGMYGRNVLYGIQLSYLLGFRKKDE